MKFKGQRAQSFLEFALVIPILLLVLLGVVELTLFMGTYINVLDLTREAARFASNRNPFADPGTKICAPVSSTKAFDFFYDTSCIFSPLANTACENSAFCDGFNSTIQLKSREDDILIYTYTESDRDPITGVIGPTIIDNDLCNSKVTTGCPWVWSNAGVFDTSPQNNWQRDCNRISPSPWPPPNPSPPPTLLPIKQENFTRAVMQSYLSSSAEMSKGFVVVEVFFCYHQVLNIPILSKFLPDPILIDTYSIMPLPAVQPTPVITPFPTP
jgi:hypothetical protein